jgi:hypothetical protein
LIASLLKARAGTCVLGLSAALLAALCLVSAKADAAAPAFVASSAAYYSGTVGGSTTVSFDVNAGSGSNTVLVIDVSDSGNLVSSMKYGSTSLAQEYQQASYSSGDMETWVCVAPASGSNLLTVTFTGTYFAYTMEAMTFSGVNQSTPVATVTQGANSSGASPWQHIITGLTVGDTLLEFFTTNGETVASDGSNTVVYNNTNNYSGAQPFTGSYMAVTATTDTMAYTLGYGANTNYQDIELLPVISGTSTNTPTPTVSPTYTQTSTLTWTNSKTATPTLTWTHSPVLSPTRTPTPTLTWTNSPVLSPTKTPTYSLTSTVAPSTPSYTITRTPTVVPPTSTSTLTLSDTNTPLPTATFTYNAPTETSIAAADETAATTQTEIAQATETAVAAAANGCAVYGNDATIVNAACYTSPYTSPAMTLGKSGANSVLFVIVGDTGSVSTISYSGGSIVDLGSASYGNGQTTNFTVYYVLNPSQGGKITVSSTGECTYEWFTYGGVTAIGNSEIASTSGTTYNSSSSLTDSYNFTPSAQASTVLEYMAFSDEGGFNTSDTMALTNGQTVSGLQMAGGSCSYATGGGFGAYGQSSGSAFAVGATVNDNSDSWGSALFAIEMLCTPAATATPTMSFTPGYIPSTPTPTPSGSPTAPAGGYPSATATLMATATAIPTATPISTASCATYGNDATFVNGGSCSGTSSYSSSYTSSAMTLGESGSGSVLIVVTSVSSDTSGVSVTYGGSALPLTYLGSASYGDGISGNFAMYYLSNPASGGTLSFTGVGLLPFSYMWFTYGGVNATAPIGNSSITSDYTMLSDYSGDSSSPTMTSNALTFYPSHESSTILEYLAFADNGGFSPSGYSVSPGTVRQNPTSAGCSYVSGAAFGDVGQSNGATMSITESLNANWQSFGGMVWAIELLCGAAESPTVSPTYSLTPTISNTLTTSLTPTQSLSFTPSTIPTHSTTLTATPTEPGGGYPTPTATMTFTPDLISVYQGLPTNMRPDGLEYVPFPTVTTDGDQFYPLYESFTTASDPGPTAGAWGGPCNTARWHIVFQGLSGQAEVETRIGPNGVSCNSGVYDTYMYSGYTDLSMPAHPQNFSSAYFWISPTAVPFTERFDAVGDPRFVPYADVLDYTGAEGASVLLGGFNGGYNWFWRNFQDNANQTPSYGTSAYADGVQNEYYTEFLTKATNDHYDSTQPSGAPGPNFDVPKLFGLIRQGVMISNGIYTAMAGFDSYYAGEGGEIGGDNSNDFQHGMPCYGGPWGSPSNSYYVDEIIGQYGTNGTSAQVDGAVYVVTGTSSTNIGWYSRPYVGELWPDGLYQSSWESSNSYSNQTWGNLNNLEQGGSAFRMAQQDIPANIAPNTNDPLSTVTLHMNQVPGPASFFNGNGGSGYFSHNGGDQFNAAIDNDGTQMATDYNLPLPSTFNVTRGWGLNMGSEQPPEWNDEPYSGEHTMLAVYSATTYTAGGISNATDWGFYAYDPGQGGYSATTEKSAAAVRMVDMNKALGTVTGNTAGGWFIMNGLAPSTLSGFNFVAQFAIAACLRTYHDAGVPTAAANASGSSFTNPNNTYTGSGPAGGGNGTVYRIPPVPLVTISHPNNSDPVAGMSTITIEWDERYARWDGNQYDENYPCPDANVGPCSSGDVIPNPAVEWHDPQPIGFNVIYKTASSANWYSVPTGTEVPAGQANNYVAGAAGSFMSDSDDAIYPGGSAEYGSHQYKLLWTGVGEANYDLEVECFRLNATNGTVAYPHYGYHEITVNTVP